MTDIQDLVRQLRAFAPDYYAPLFISEAADALEALQKEVEELRCGEHLCKRCQLRKEVEELLLSAPGSDRPTTPDK